MVVKVTGRELDTVTEQKYIPVLIYLHSSSSRPLSKVGYDNVTTVVPCSQPPLTPGNRPQVNLESFRSLSLHQSLLSVLIPSDD